MASMLLNQCLFRGAPRPVNNISLPASPLMAASSSTSMKSCTPALSSLRGRDHHQVVSSSPDHVGVQKYSSVLLGARSLNKSTTTTTSTHVVMASTAGSEDHYCMDSINEIRSRRGPASRSSSSTAHVVTSSSCSTHRSRSSSHVVMAGGGGGGGDHDDTKDKDSMEDDKQALDTASQQTKLETGTPYVPIYVMLPLGVINKKCELVDLNGLAEQLKKLKSANVDGVMVDCWWGIVEAEKQVYKWTGYKHLFQVVRDSNLKLQVVMSFHACGGNVGDDFSIPLPSWIAEIGNSNGDIFFTDEAGKRNYECLSWGIDKKRVLKGRTAVEVYLDYMSSFRREFSSFFNDGTISEIEIGLGPCGELRYPSYPETHGWRYPGVGQFQCYDAYLKKSLHSAAATLGKSNWSEAPENASTYNSAPHETAFFSDGGDFDSYRGRFFLSWYAEVLIAHGDIVLSMAKHVFKGTPIAAKVAGVHWCFKSTSHAAELTAGFYNSANRDGYTAIMAMLKKHGAALNFTCVELRTEDQQSSCPEAMTDPERLVWQVLNDGWDHGLKVAAENALPCYTREGYEKILANTRPFDSPDGRHLCAFTYLRMSPILFQRHHFDEFKKFVKKLHGSD